VQDASKTDSRRHCSECNRNRLHVIRIGKVRLFTKADAPAWPAAGEMAQEVFATCRECGHESISGRTAGPSCFSV
jgi:hypothetical protein